MIAISMRSRCKGFGSDGVTTRGLGGGDRQGGDQIGDASGSTVSETLSANSETPSGTINVRKGELGALGTELTTGSTFSE